MDKDMESAIREHAQLFDLPENAVIATALDGRIVYWSAGAAALYGWKAEDVIGRDVVDVTPSDLSRADAIAIMKALQEGRTWSGKFQVRSKDGEQFNVAVKDVPVRSNTGELIGIIGVSVAD
jgi:PAS domain S-box-containing protein